MPWSGIKADNFGHLCHRIVQPAAKVGKKKGRNLAVSPWIDYAFAASLKGYNALGPISPVRIRIARSRS